MPRPKIFLAILSALALLHWALLWFRIPLLQSFDEWFWFFTDKPLPHAWLIFPLGGLFYAIAEFARRQPQRRALIILFLFMAALASQYAFALMEGRGLEPLRERLEKTGHAEFASIAAYYEGMGWEIVTQYEKWNDGIVFGPYSKTKPPGTLLVYLAAQKGANAIVRPFGAREKFEAQKQFASFLFPFLAGLAVVPLFFLCRLIFDDEAAWQACLLYAAAPNFALITMELDQVILPLLAAASLVCVIGQSRTATAIPAAIGGVLAYAAVYVSFSAIPLIALAGLAVFASPAKSRREKLGMGLGSGIGFGCGLLAAGMLANLLLRYDIFERYERAMRVHEKWKYWDGGVGTTVYFAEVNLIEFAVWVGLPMMAILLFHSLESFKSPRMLLANRSRYFGISVLLVILLVALFGRTKAEVARLWLYFLPPICVVVCAAIGEWYPQDRRRVFLAVLALTLLTTFSIKANQDFWVNETPMVRFAGEEP